MANPKQYRGCRNSCVSFTRPTLSKYISGFAEWAKGCTATCKKCGEAVTNPKIEIKGNSVIASYQCERGHITRKTATEAEIRRTYAEV